MKKQGENHCLKGNGLQINSLKLIQSNFVCFVSIGNIIWLYQANHLYLKEFCFIAQTCFKIRLASIKDWGISDKTMACSL
ncbi:MAG: hypothetical protein ACJAXH_003398 [Colwellia sp.]|jgi:hypothetical protein